MSEEIPQANPPMSAKELSAVSKLTEADLQVIDAAILADPVDGWSKVARVVSMAEEALKGRYPALSYLFYAQRLAQLVEDGRLESQGNLEYMRFSEVRVPKRSEGR